MRLLTLLLMGILPELALSQQVDLLRTSPYNTLCKYSYLLVPMVRDKKDNKKIIPLATGTGFFIRHQQKLYLVSAKHVFTNCEVYAGATRDITPVAIKILYNDTSGRLDSLMLFIPKWKRKKKCRSAPADPDVDIMDVTKYLLDKKMNTIDSLMPDSFDRYTLWPGETVVAFGYSNEPKDVNTFNIRPNLTPVGYIAHGRTIPDDQKSDIRDAMSIYYFATEPGLPEGVSGAPIFRVSSDGAGATIVEFVGIQSGAKEDGLSGYIVQRRLLWASYHLK